MLVCVITRAICTRDRGCSAHPAFPAPSILRDNDRQTSGKSRRENADVYLLFKAGSKLSQRHREEHLRRSNPSYDRYRCEMDCFAEPVIGRRFAPTRWLAMTLMGRSAC